MTRKKLFPLLIAGTLVAVAIFGAITFRTVQAQATTPTPAAPSQPNTLPNNQQRPGKVFRGGERGGYTNQDLADALGITVEQLQTAQQAAVDEALKQAVSKGLLTQEQADQLKARGLGRFHFGDKGIMANSGIDLNALLAAQLNVSVEQLTAARLKAFNMAVDREVQSGNLTQEQADLMKGRQALANDAKFQASIKSAYEAAVKQAVTDGVITQAQADQILANNNGIGFPGGKWFGGGHGFGGRGGHGFPGTDEVPANPAEPVTPSAGGA